MEDGAVWQQEQKPQRRCSAMSDMLVTNPFLQSTHSGAVWQPAHPSCTLFPGVSQVQHDLLHEESVRKLTLPVACINHKINVISKR